MEHEPKPLPESDRVPITALSRLFDHVSTSYKFLFFLAFLEACERRLFASPMELTVQEILVDMLVLAWYPHVYFKLSFGWQDKVARELDSLPTQAFAGIKFSVREKDQLRECIRSSSSARSLVRFVPFRLIRPFLPELPADNRDHPVNWLIKEASAEYFTDRKPLYKISADEKILTVHPDWLYYLAQNIAVVRAWASWHYLQYMQKQNPMVPSLASKLFPPLHRESLQRQISYWSAIAQNSEVRCIYSDQPIEPGSFDLDHFLPWSYVVHDELWNLIPVIRDANNAKRDRLPDEQYIPKFVSTQQRGLSLARELLPKRQWNEQAGIYEMRLNVSGDDWLRSERFELAYVELLTTQLRIAHLNGFESGWRFREPDIPASC
jgi:hypothetical protein